VNLAGVDSPPVAEERNARTVWAACERILSGFDPEARDPRKALLALADRAPEEVQSDRYGSGPLAERLEERIAGLLGMEVAVWMPSGTMAQQIALRVHARRKRLNVVAFHPYCHLESHEEHAYQWLHDLRAVLLGDRDRLITPEDVTQLREPVAALLLELPQRDLGGQLPAWEDLVAMCEAARTRGAALHLDGARLWQCPSFYGRPLEEIAGLFDTAYVSFYKDLGAPAGCALAGPQDLIDEARVWQVRHGGRLFSAYPFLLAAERGLDEVLPRLGDYVERARELGAALAELDDVSLVPDPPQTAMFHVLVRRPLHALEEASLDLAEETKAWLGFWHGTGDPQVQRSEVTITEASFSIPPAEARELWQALLERATAPAG
jgi:threonine aldolase